MSNLLLRIVPITCLFESRTMFYGNKLLQKKIIYFTEIGRYKIYLPICRVRLGADNSCLTNTVLVSYRFPTVFSCFRFRYRPCRHSGYFPNSFAVRFWKIIRIIQNVGVVNHHGISENVINIVWRHNTPRTKQNKKNSDSSREIISESNWYLNVRNSIFFFSFYFFGT